MTKWWSMSNFKVAFFFYFPAVRKTWPDVAKMTKSNNRLIEMAEFNVVYLSSVCVVWVDWWTRLGTSRRSSPVNHIDVCVCGRHWIAETNDSSATKFSFCPSCCRSNDTSMTRLALQRLRRSTVVVQATRTTDWHSRSNDIGISAFVNRET